MNRKAHVAAGMLAGAITVPLLNRPYSNQQEWHQILGAIAGGWVGGRMPDIIDPPTSPRHRSLGHGIGPTFYAYRFIQDRITPVWEAQWLQLANNFRTKYLSEAKPLLKILYWIAWQICHCLVWACKGFIVGYASHLLLDAGSKMSLPLIG